MAILGTIKQIVGLMNQSGVGPGTTTGTNRDIGLLEDLVAAIDVTEDTAGTSCDVTIEDSFDGGATWFTWIQFSSLSTTGREVAVPSRPPSGLVRARADVVGGSWTVRVVISGNPSR